MNKKINFIASILFVMLIFEASLFSCAAEDIFLYVSPNGNDNWAGTASAPLKTPEGARKKVRGIKKGNGNIHIIFHEGDYEFTEPLTFNGGDAGTEWAKIYYEAAANEDVNFVGSKKIDFSEAAIVTDEKILERLPETSRGKVVQIDLKKSGIKSLEYVDFMKNQGNVISDISLFLNNKEQMIAQWPNGRANFTTAGATYDKNGKFQSKDPETKRWGNVKESYLYGFFSQDYNFDKTKLGEVDPENNTLTFAHPLGGGVIQDTATRRYQAFNLLEELDVASEWYIDRENLILYYFPPYELSQNDKIELAINKDVMVKLTSYDNNNKDNMHIVFKGINFSKTVGDVFNISADYVTIDDCIFEYIGGIAIENSGEFVDVKNNVFTKVNNYLMRSIDYTSNAKSKDDPIYFRNNYIYDCTNYVSQGCQAVVSEDQNVTVENNTFHYSQAAAMSSGWTSREVKFRYNECYNLMKERADIGMVYTGKSRYYHNFEVAYNYLYDFNQKTEFFEAGGQAIYMDDLYGGAYIHHNIVVNGGGGIQIGGGHHNTVESNVIIDVVTKPLVTDNRGEQWSYDWVGTFLPQAQTSLSYDRVVKRNPGIWDTIDTDKLNLPLNNALVDNVSNCDFSYNSRFKELGIIHNNIKVDNLDSFVNPEKGDYRIKSDSELASSLSDPWTEKGFDIFKVGVSSEVKEKLFERNGSFSLVYPKNGDVEVNALKAELHWEQAFTADEYVVTIATDRDMKNVIEIIETPYNRAEPQKLETGGKTYYWTVTAKNKNFKSPKEWETASEPFKFTTSKYDIIDYITLEYKMSDAKKLKAIMNDTTFEASAKDKVDEALLKAYDVLNSAYGEVTVAEYDAAINSLNEAVDYANKHKIYNYVSIEKENFADTDKWILPEKVTAEPLDEGMKFTTDGSISYAIKEDKKVNEIYTFKAKIDFKDESSLDGSFACFDLFRENVGALCWTDTGYMVIVKRHKIELQKYEKQLGGILNEVSSDIVADEGWHEISYGLIEEPDCYRVVFRIDGETIFDYSDYDKNLTSGYMGFANVAIDSLTLDFSEASSGNMNEAVYKVTAKQYSDSGSWSDGENSRISTTAGDTAVWDIAPGIGRKEIWFALSEGYEYGGNLEISVTYDYNKSREGEEVTKLYTISEENIKDGWCYIDTDDVQAGSFTLKLTNKGGKPIEISAVKTVNAD